MPEVMTRLGPKLLAELDEVAEEIEVTRAETIRNILRLGLDRLYELADESEDEDEDQDEDENEDEETETCDECKADIPSDAKFCPQCGIEFEDEPDEEPEDEEPED